MLPRNAIIIYLGRGLLGGNSIAHKPINQTDPSLGAIFLSKGELKILSSGKELRGHFRTNALGERFGTNALEQTHQRNTLGKPPKGGMH